jgi:hypothetical protein
VTTPAPALDADVRLRILHEFLEGQTPSPDSVAATLGLSPAEAIAAIHRLAAGRAIVLAPGTHDIVMAAPFAARPTDHRVVIDGREYFANCIWDALGIPAMLGRAVARIETVCADCQSLLNLSVNDEQLTSDPSVAHFAVPAARWWANIVFT